MSEMTLSTQRVRALELHEKIMANGQIMVSALLAFCQELKQMRDEKLFEELGYTSFEQYVEGAVGLKKRQAYTYIATYEKIGPHMLAEHAGLGITKLSLISQISAVDRADVLDENDIEDMSTKEVEELVEKLNNAGEQISMLETEKKDAVDSEAFLKEQLAKAEEKLQEQEQLIEDMKKEPIDGLAVDCTEQISDRDSAQDAIDAAVKKAVAEAKKKAKEDAEAAAQKKIAAAEQAAIEKGRKEAEEKQKELMDAAEAEKKAALERAAALEKKLQLESSTESTQFALLFEQLQGVAFKMGDVLKQMEEKGQQEKADKLRTAFIAAMAEVVKQVGGKE